MTAYNLRSAHSPLTGRKVLEVIVTSVEEAIEAAEGGADRLEIVRSLDEGGLTPSLALVQEIMSAVRLPVRVMLRDRNSMSLALPEMGEPDGVELDRLACAAGHFARSRVDGLVLGFVRDGAVDAPALHRILSASPGVSVTFHRAFEHLHSPLQALRTLSSFGQIDRILVRVREDGAGVSLQQIKMWQRLAAPHIRFIAGIGLDRTLLGAIREDSTVAEVHVGRGARDPETNGGAVSRAKVAALKSALL